MHPCEVVLYLPQQQIFRLVELLPISQKFDTNNKYFLGLASVTSLKRENWLLGLAKIKIRKSCGNEDAVFTWQTTTHKLVL